MPAKILVPVDDSPESRKALAQAVDLAARLNAAVTLMTVIVTPALPTQLLPPEQVSRLSAHFREAGERLLAQLRPVAEAAGVPVEIRYVEGVPADEIVAEAGKGYLFVVMSARGTGLSGRERSLMGSVSDRVLRQSSVPVLLVKGDG